MTTPARLSFRRDIQGLRALAVVLVILFHASVPRSTGGFVGVDVFFVISGYVITGLLWRQGEQAVHKKLLRFYARRIRRILPAATVVLLATLAATYYWLGAYTGRELGIDERWASFFAANFRFIHVQTNYFLSQQPPPLNLQYWSLAVEEQFYLCFPLLVFTTVAAIAARYRRYVLLAGLAALIAGSSWWCATQTASNPIAAYYSPFTRFWELALGAFVVLLPEHVRFPGRIVNATLGWLGLVAIIASAMAFNNTTSYPGTAVWLPVFGTAILLWTGKDPTGFGPEKLLAVGPIVFIGDISYSLYLWHYPLLNIPLQYSLSPTMPAISRVEQVAATFVLSVLTYFVLENPVRRSKWLDRHQWVVFALAACLIGSVWLATTLCAHFASL